jgi:hypothetical protein
MPEVTPGLLSLRSIIVLVLRDSVPRRLILWRRIAPGSEIGRMPVAGVAVHAPGAYDAMRWRLAHDHVLLGAEGALAATTLINSQTVAP